MSKAEATYCFNSNNMSCRPKSKKELRAEKKAAKMASSTASKTKQNSMLQAKEEKLRLLKKERRNEQLEERKSTKQKREREEQIQNSLQSGWEKPRGKKRQRIERAYKANDVSISADNDNIDKKISWCNTVVGGESNCKTLEMGVMYHDVILGNGPDIVQENSLVTVRYKLTGGKYGVLIDSSNKFTFRIGKGDVIMGWDIGVRGMSVGGIRKLIIPKKAGYKEEDIGAGPGALLFADIALLSCTA